MRQEGKKVFVGLSGGVDSSVSAALLKEEGYDVRGVFIKVWQPVDKNGNPLFSCTWKDDRLDAMRVSAKLRIPFQELDLKKEYKKEVVDYMISEYKRGRTPNPDVMCNRFIKFGAFYRWARKRGADFIATGHYSRIRQIPNHKLQKPNKSKIINSKSLTIDHSLLKKTSGVKGFGLFVGSDPQKDQSYFLWQIRKEQLPRVLFPVGGMQKSQVRTLAKTFGLITADKKDSQGLCFIGKLDMKEFLGHYIKDKPGKVLDEEGVALGEHKGAFLYTFGERIGNTEATPNTKHGSNTEPLYVIAKDIKKNTITVSPKSPSGILGGAVMKVSIKKCNWLMQPMHGKTYSVRARYREVLKPATLKIDTSRFIVEFQSPQTVAPGQSLVLYDGDVLVGGGIIS